GMLELLWQAQVSRHGGAPKSRRQNQAEAEAGLHLAPTLGQWLGTRVLYPASPPPPPTPTPPPRPAPAAPPARPARAPPPRGCRGGVATRPRRRPKPPGGVPAGPGRRDRLVPHRRDRPVHRAASGRRGLDRAPGHHPVGGDRPTPRKLLPGPGPRHGVQLVPL